MTAEQAQAVKFLREHRDYMSERLADYESGNWEIGRLENGQKINETQATVVDLKRRIAELDRIIAAYEI